MNDAILDQNSMSAGLPDNFPESSGSFFQNNITALPAGEKFVVFFLNEHPYGVASKRIAEVTSALAVAPLPNSPEWLSGIANLRGEIVSVLNLPKIINKEGSQTSGKTKFVILHTSDSDASIAFYADRLGEIIFITDQEIEAVADENFPFISGKAPYNTQFLQVIDAEKLLCSLLFN